jgi:dTMP kinase
VYIIDFDGPDGAGKSTQIEILKKKLEQKGKKVHVEHFPRYDSPVGNLIGEYLKGKHDMPSFDTLQMLYAADQTDFRITLDNLLIQGYDYVLLDRYSLSTIVFYCARFNDVELMNKVMSWQTGIKPTDLTIVLTTETSITDKEELVNLDELERDKSFMDRTREMYLKVSEALKGKRNIEIIDADDTIPIVSYDIENTLIKHNLI